MLQLDPLKTLHTLGIAGTQAAGLMAAQHSSMVKRMHPGRSAQAGVYGALLANKGFTGIEDILEASYGGFCSTFCDNPNLSHLTQDLGERFETLNVGCKPYPCCGSNHTSIDALKKILRDHSEVCAESVDKIRIRTTRATKLHVGWPYEPKEHDHGSDESPLPWHLLHDRDFVDQSRRNRSKRRGSQTTRTIEVLRTQSWRRSETKGATASLEVQLQDGRNYSEKVLHAKGSDKHPMTREEVLQKFRLLASRVLSRSRVEKLEETLLNLEKLSDARKIAKLLIP
jgi:2-methylcitrate dehydratase PrpD